jgi:CO/xanthine dehydrogenase Mo-binding subunit
VVNDIGNPIDIKLVEGQIHGGMIQGMGLGMMENMTSKKGKIEQNNFEAYSVPTSKDIPEMAFDLVINKYDDGPYGAKGLGELSLVGVPPAIASAVEDAIGQKIFKIPVTPEYILEVKAYANDN